MVTTIHRFNCTVLGSIFFSFPFDGVIVNSGQGGAEPQVCAYCKLIGLFMCRYLLLGYKDSRLSVEGFT